jgi:Zn-dependent peptidase ImmA (M78 family)
MASSVSKGDFLEEKVFDTFRREIEEDRFLVRMEQCKIHRKKGYYSKDRQSEIIFDVSIEAYYPDATEYSLVFLIECKNYENSVEVGEIEQFNAKVEQVAAANAKAIFVTTSSFQSGARKYAKSKGIGLIRYVDPHELKWELRRSPSAITSSTSNIFAHEIENVLSVESYKGRLFDFVFDSRVRSTNSLWDFFEDLLQDLENDDEQLSTILNRRSKLDSLFPYITHEQIEDVSQQILGLCGYTGAAIDLNKISAQIPNLKVIENDSSNEKILGTASFDPPEIILYQDEETNRRRFTYAHELSHFLLNHGKFMRRDSCEESDVSALKGSSILPEEIQRMEYQANLMASCLLMPRQSFIRSFMRIARNLDIQDRGFGYIYYDQQPCNVKDYMLVTSSLMKLFEVSRTSVRIRLETLGLLNDAKPAWRAT